MYDEKINYHMKINDFILLYIIFLSIYSTFSTSQYMYNYVLIFKDFKFPVCFFLNTILVKTTTVCLEFRLKSENLHLLLNKTSLYRVILIYEFLCLL